MALVCVKKKNKFPVCVGGASDAEAISSMWSNHYHSLLNCLTPSKVKLFVDSHISSCIESDLNNVMCSVPVINVLLHMLSLSSANGPDQISAYHLPVCYADPSISFYLSCLFNMCIMHGYSL